MPFFGPPSIILERTRASYTRMNHYCVRYLFIQLALPSPHEAGITRRSTRLKELAPSMSFLCSIVAAEYLLLRSISLISKALAGHDDGTLSACWADVMNPIQ